MELNANQVLFLIKVFQHFSSISFDLINQMQSTYSAGFSRENPLRCKKKKKKTWGAPRLIITWPKATRAPQHAYVHTVNLKSHYHDNSVTLSLVD